MSYKRLYAKDDILNYDGIKLSTKVHDFLRPTFEEWHKKGFSMPDISHVIVSEVISVGARIILENRVDKNQGK